MTFKVGDKVVGNARGYEHRVGETGVVAIVVDDIAWVNWASGATHMVDIEGIDLVFLDVVPASPIPPRKMHPDDFIQAVNDFATDNGFSIGYITFQTQDGNTVQSVTPQPLTD